MNEEMEGVGKVNNRKKIYLHIMGGCGNQFFQYAFARSLQEKIGAELIVDYRFVRNDPHLWEGSDNVLKDFNTIEYEYADRRILKDRILSFVIRLRQFLRLKEFEGRTYRYFLCLARFLPYIGVYYFDSSYYKFPITNRKNIIIHGYFESAEYFSSIDDKITKELAPKHKIMDCNQDIYERIKETESVCITIKRRDIENPDMPDVYTYDMSYFYTGIEYIKSRVQHPVFFIFSDNLEWCKKNVTLDGEYYFETEGNPIWEKIRLMSSCKHFIIHNSTFSWWVQHLSSNPDKIVLAPVKWLPRNDQPIDIYEDNWLYITPDGKVVDEHE